MLLQLLTAGVPVLIMAVCDWLKMDGWPARTNALIVVATTVFLAFIWALFTGQFAQNMYLNFLAVIGISFGIMALPEMAPIRAWLQRVLTSPFAMLPQARIVDAGPPVTLRASLPRHEQALTQRPDVVVDADVSAQTTRPMAPAMPEQIAPDEVPAPTQTHDE